MPYTSKQCRAFGRMSQGKPVGKGKERKVQNPPTDWKKHCTKTSKRKR